MSKTNIVFLDAYTTNPGDISFESLERLGHFKRYDRTTIKALEQRCSHAEIVIVNKFPINAETLSFMPFVRYIVVSATGYNNIDLNAVRARNIQVSNVKAYSTESVAQHVFASILAFFNRIEYYNNQVKEGRWASNQDFCFYDSPIIELKSQTIGIYGFGQIGERVGEIASAFGMKVLAYTRNRAKQKPEYVRFVDEVVLFKESDVLTLHCPLSESTSGLINSGNLAFMKKNAIIVNTGRGGLVNEHDLLEALENKIVSGAILDVLNTEPPQNDLPLTKHPRCFVTPHIAWASQAARIKLVHGIAENISAYLSGRIINSIFES